MECPKCHGPVRLQQTECPHCGLVFAKYSLYLERQAQRPLDEQAEERVALLRELGRFLLTPPEPKVGFWWGRLVLWLAFLVWGWSFIRQDVASLVDNPSFLHSVNLPFHEAGHVVFGVLGQFIGSLGGTLGQLLMPLVCGVALLRHSRDTFGASLCLWWFGQNFFDIAPYIADARAGQLPLLGGNFGHSSPYGFHDWEYLLGETGLLAYDQTLAAISLNLGRLLVLTSLAWGGYLLWRSRADR